MAVQASSLQIPVRNVIADMSFSEIREVVASAKGAQLRAMLDAAQDVAEQSQWPDLRRTAQVIIACGRQSHPDYFDATLRGAVQR